MTEDVLRIFARQLKKDWKNIEEMRFLVEREMYFLVVDMFERGIDLPEQGRLFLDRKLQQVKQELTKGVGYKKRVGGIYGSHETSSDLHRRICEIEKYRENNENTYFREIVGFLRPIYENPKAKNLLIRVHKYLDYNYS